MRWVGAGLAVVLGAVACSSFGGEDGSADGGSIALPPGCDASKEPKDEPCLVTESAGVFVSTTGSDDAAGTKAAPLRTIGRAIQRATTTGKPRVFVCEGTYLEKILLDPNAEGVELHGGFACKDFSYSGARARIVPDDPGVVLRVDRLPRATEITDMDFVAKDAAEPGASSVAGVVTASESVTFRRVAFIAGRGMPGADGVTKASNWADGIRAGWGSADARAYRECTCTDGTKSLGGAAGASGKAPLAGASMPATMPVNDNAGQNSLPCTAGTVGADGAAGRGSDPAPAGVARLDDVRIVRPAAQAGKPGLPAQGGGGGGVNTTNPGSGGGCGGCGGAGGGPGQAGGSSVALVVQSTATILVDSTLSAADGAGGGKGGTGESGQDGAPPGTATGGACFGGAGGRGGGGGGGGGGAGGLAIGVLFGGPVAPSWDGAVLDHPDTLPRVTFGQPGSPGAGGLGGAPSGDGTNRGAAGVPGPNGIARPTARLD